MGKARQNVWIIQNGGINGAHLHVYISFLSTQVWHLTWQHHTTRHLQDDFITRIWTLWPRPQHMLLQLSPLSHSRPEVPREKVLLEQKSGESERYKRALEECEFIMALDLRLLYFLALLLAEFIGILLPDLARLYFLFFRLRPCSRFLRGGQLFSAWALTAWSYFFFKLRDVSVNGASCFQQVLFVHDPETPWHLQTFFKPSFTVWKKET